MLPKLNQLAPELKPLQLEPFVHAINKVEPTKIRIKSDEVTCKLHIITRFQIEHDLFAKKIQVSELPEVWN